MPQSLLKEIGPLCLCKQDIRPMCLNETLQDRPKRTNYDTIMQSKQLRPMSAQKLNDINRHMHVNISVKYQFIGLERIVVQPLMRYVAFTSS